MLHRLKVRPGTVLGKKDQVDQLGRAKPSQRPKWNTAWSHWAPPTAEDVYRLRTVCLWRSTSNTVSVPGLTKQGQPIWSDIRSSVRAAHAWRRPVTAQASAFLIRHSFHFSFSTGGRLTCVYSNHTSFSPSNPSDHFPLQEQQTGCQIDVWIAASKVIAG